MWAKFALWFKGIWKWLLIGILILTNIVTLAHMTISVSMAQTQTQTVTTSVYNVNDNQNLNLVLTTVESHYGDKISYQWQAVKFSTFTNELAKYSSFQLLFLKTATVDGTTYVGIPVFSKTQPTRVSITNSATNFQSQSNYIKPFLGGWK